MNEQNLYGFNPSNVVEDPPMVTLYTNNLSEIMREYTNGMYAAFNLGRLTREYYLSDIPIQSNIEDVKFWGVFDDSAYGVYDSFDKFQNSSRYWHNETTQIKEFESYDDALAFARNGLAGILGITPENIPHLRHPKNWREQVSIQAFNPDFEI